MRLIDADKSLDMLFRADLDYESMGGVNYCIDKIEEQPTAYDIEKEHYTPSSTAGDYGPSNPWQAPGMSERDFF